MVIEFFSGTGSVTKYHLRRSSKVRVVMIDTQPKSWARKYISTFNWNRICYIQADIADLTLAEIVLAIFRRWPKLKPSSFTFASAKTGTTDYSSMIRMINIVHIHGSPSCRSHSIADRGISRHRDQYGRPLSQTAILDDRALENFCDILNELMTYYSTMLATIENPISPTFTMVPCIARLIRQRDASHGLPRWQPLTCSYCKHTDVVLDYGKTFPQKDTIVCAAGVKPSLTLDMCKRDCSHLLDRIVPGQVRRHKLVICRNSTQWPEQIRITDVWQKGLIPQGLIDTLWRSHIEWLHDTKDSRSYCHNIQKSMATSFHADMVELQNLCTFFSKTDFGDISNPDKPNHVGRAYSSDENGDAVEPRRSGRLRAMADAATPDPPSVHINTDQYDDQKSDSSHSLQSASEADSDEWTLIDDEDSTQPDIVREGMFENGVRKDSTPVRLITRPVYKVRDVDLSEFYRFIPSAVPNFPRWLPDTLEPWSLHFVDPCFFDIKLHGKKAMALVFYDFVSKGIRIKFVTSLYMSGHTYDEFVTEESIDKRSVRVTVGTDGDGAMKLVKHAALRRGIGYLPMPPWSPNLNPVEKAIDVVKVTTMSCLLAACTKDGPITTAFVVFAAPYVCHVRERFARPHQYDVNDFRSSFEINTGVPPKYNRLVPFGAAGYAYVPRGLRESREAPLYLRAEPVLMLGYQDFYSDTYEVLTRYNSTIFVEHVNWDFTAPLGVMLPYAGDPEPRSGKTIERLQMDTPVFRQATKQDQRQETTKSHTPVNNTADNAGTDFEPTASTPQLLPVPVIRLDGDKMYRGDEHGSLPKAAPYIYERCKKLDGLTMDEATKQKFPDAKGVLRPYRRRDLLYDLDKWLKIEIEDPGGEQHTHQVCSLTRHDQTRAELSEHITDDQTRADNDSMKKAAQTMHVSTNLVQKTAQSFRVKRAEEEMRLAFNATNLEDAFLNGANLISHDEGIVLSEETLPDAKLLSLDGQTWHCILGTSRQRHTMLAVRGLSFKKELSGPDKDKVLRAYNTEFGSLFSTILKEIHPGDPEYEEAKRTATDTTVLLDWKRTGIYKVRVCVRGDTEDSEKLDGEGFDYSSNVCEIGGIRNLVFHPRKNPFTHVDENGRKCRPPRGSKEWLEQDGISSADVSVAYSQAHAFGPEEAPRYLRIRDPVTGKVRYAKCTRPLYGSRASAKLWELTLHSWLTEIGFTQGSNEPCAFFHKDRKLTVESYSDDLFALGRNKEAIWFWKLLEERFDIKDPQFLDLDNPLDHLGMLIFEDYDGIYITMEDYIVGMAQKLGLDLSQPKFENKRKPPMDGPITDMTPLNQHEAAWFMSATGCIGWVSSVGRPDVRIHHSRCAAYMSAPNKGAVRAAKSVCQYVIASRHLALHQEWDKDPNNGWVFYSDSDQAGNAELVNKRKSHLSWFAMRHNAPVAWGSKSTTVTFDERYADFTESGRNYRGLKIPTCNHLMKELHADISSASCEIYAASIALNEILHLGYVTEELGLPFTWPIELRVDNATAIHFSQGSSRRSKLRHIDSRQAWVEALRDESVVVLTKVDTKVNLADLNSKLLEWDTFQRLRDTILVIRPIPGRTAHQSNFSYVQAYGDPVDIENWTTGR